MSVQSSKKFAKQLIEKAVELGADLAGIASVQALRKSPSHEIYAKLNDHKSVGSKEGGDIPSGKITWPADAISALIIAIEHSEAKPELDWWQEGYSGGTQGNRLLISTIERLAGWLAKEKGVKTYKLSYFIERSGIFLKDAAVLAGLGCIGKNNILVTPKFGPRVRLRAMFLNVDLPPTGPIDFDPCQECEMPCRGVCPQNAFKEKIYLPKEFGIAQLPGRSSVFSRYLCSIQMEADIDRSQETAVKGKDEATTLIKYCRRCEFACPVGL